MPAFINIHAKINKQIKSDKIYILSISTKFRFKRKRLNKRGQENEATVIIKEKSTSN